MATVMDITLFDFFSPLFLFLLVYATTYALSARIKLFGENKGIHAIIALAVSILFLFSGAAKDVLLMALPWYMILAFLVLSILMIFGIFGAGESEFKAAMKEKRVINWVVLLSVIILLFGLAHSLGQPALEAGQENVSQLLNVSEGSTATDSFTDNLYRTLFHPKVLGMLAVLIIALFSVLYLSYS